jgi:hypothetical protein
MRLKQALSIQSAAGIARTADISDQRLADGSLQKLSTKSEINEKGITGKIELAM